MWHVTAWQMPARLEPVSPGYKTHLLLWRSAGSQMAVTLVVTIRDPLHPSTFLPPVPSAGKSSLNDTNALDNAIVAASAGHKFHLNVWHDPLKVTPLMLVMDHHVFWLIRHVLPHLPALGYISDSEAAGWTCGTLIINITSPHQTRDT